MHATAAGGGGWACVRERARGSRGWGAPAANAPPAPPPPLPAHDLPLALAPCSTIYNMCTQKPPYDYSEQLYQRYRDAFNNYISDAVRCLVWLCGCVCVCVCCWVGAGRGPHHTAAWHARGVCIATARWWCAWRSAWPAAVCSSSQCRRRSHTHTHTYTRTRTRTRTRAHTHRCCPRCASTAMRCCSRSCSRAGTTTRSWCAGSRASSTTWTGATLVLCVCACVRVGGRQGVQLDGQGNVGVGWHQRQAHCGHTCSRQQLPPRCTALPAAVLMRCRAAARAQHNTAQHSTTQHNTAQHNTTQHNTTQHNTTQHNTTQHRYYVLRHSLHPLKDVGLLCFRGERCLVCWVSPLCVCVCVCVRVCVCVCVCACVRVCVCACALCSHFTVYTACALNAAHTCTARTNNRPGVQRHQAQRALSGAQAD
jgi:hypothetical protein